MAYGAEAPAVKRSLGPVCGLQQHRRRDLATAHAPCHRRHFRSSCCRHRRRRQHWLGGRSGGSGSGSGVGPPPPPPPPRPLPQPPQSAAAAGMRSPPPPPQPQQSPTLAGGGKRRWGSTTMTARWPPPSPGLSFPAGHVGGWGIHITFGRGRGDEMDRG